MLQVALMQSAGGLKEVFLEVLGEPSPATLRAYYSSPVRCGKRGKSTWGSYWRDGYIASPPPTPSQCVIMGSARRNSSLFSFRGPRDHQLVISGLSCLIPISRYFLGRHAISVHSSTHFTEGCNKRNYSSALSSASRPTTDSSTVSVALTRYAAYKQ